MGRLPRKARRQTRIWLAKRSQEFRTYVDKLTHAVENDRA